MIEGLAIPHRRRQGPQPGLPGLFVQIGFRHHVREGAVHGQHFRHILKAGEAAFELVIDICFKRYLYEI
jgi:hypothetical protein